MASHDSSHLGKLIRKDRVHRSIYLDSDIFEMELERIYAKAWVFVGHDSQVPNVGDFVTTFIGKQPVVMARHTDGKVHLLYNRCGHRGAVVENLPKGNAKHFRCCYHGWVFKTNGELASVPLKNGYPEDFDLADPMLGMVPVARVDSYRGFVFANLSREGPGLDEFLGGMKAGIDYVCDRSPEGTVRLGGGVHKYQYRGNWKFQVENLCDMYHGPFNHDSTLNPSGEQFKRREGDTGGALLVEDGEISSQLDTTGVWIFDHGHSYMGGVKFRGEKGGPAHDEYLRRMNKAYGKKRADEILSRERHGFLFYPNMLIHGASSHVRVIRPLAVDLTEVRIYPVLMNGAPDEMNKKIIQYMNVTHSPASMIQTDDLESFKRCYQGVHAQGADWVLLARGLDQERPDTESGGLWSLGTHEHGMRNQYQAWKGYMAG